MRLIGCGAISRLIYGTTAAATTTARHHCTHGVWRHSSSCWWRWYSHTSRRSLSSDARIGRPAASAVQRWLYSASAIGGTSGGNCVVCGCGGATTVRHCSSGSKWRVQQQQQLKEEEEAAAGEAGADDTLSEPVCEAGVAGLDSRLLAAGVSHRLLLVQPVISWGRQRQSQLEQQQLLAEARALVASVPGWRVAGERQLSVPSLRRFSVLGSGQWEEVRRLARQSSATALLLNVARLSAAQCCHLESLLDRGTAVWDRYALVLAIIRSHAVSRLARRQVALAELPYLRTRLRATGQYTPARAEALRMREQRLRRELADTERRSTPLLRRIAEPTVAVVGYTNAGKTSLIAALSGSEKAVGRHAVFATLDVSTHRCQRPAGISGSYHVLSAPAGDDSSNNNNNGAAVGEHVTMAAGGGGSGGRFVRHVYLDTVGFMRQLPSALVDGFRATLREASAADLLLHVADVSQPDWRQQHQHVLSTLQQLGLPEQLVTPDRQLLVANKCDLVSRDVCQQLVADGWHCVSAVGGTGVPQLLDEVQFQLLRVSGRKLAELSVATGSAEYSWLLRHCHVLQLSHPSGSFDDQQQQLTQLSVAVSERELAQLRRNCPNCHVTVI